MVDYSYSTVPNKLKAFLKKIQEIGVPDFLDKKFLASTGFSGSNDPSIIAVLKFIRFVEDSGNPTERWIEYRNKKLAGSILAKAIYEAYEELFNLYPDAYKRSREELKDFFRTKTTAGSKAVNNTVSTFLNLCEFADFSIIPIEDKEKPKEIPPEKTELGLDAIKKEIRGLGTGVTININIQLTLPETTDESVYDKFFAALKKHLLTQDGNDD